MRPEDWKSTNLYSIKLKVSVHVIYCKVLGFGLVWISLLWYLRRVLFTLLWLIGNLLYGPSLTLKIFLQLYFPRLGLQEDATVPS